MPLYTVPSTGTYRSTDGKDVRYFTQGTQIDMTDAVRFGMSGAIGADPTAITATSDGTGPGQLQGGVTYAVVTSASSSFLVTLPTPIPGSVLALQGNATGYKLQSSAPATVAINGGVGAGKKSTIAASQLTVCVCNTATSWVCTDTAADGTAAATAAAA